MANEHITAKLKTLPADPGVYLYKNSGGEIIYVGKAAILKNRVRSYFQAGRPHDYKTQLLVNDIADLDWLVVASEIDALFLESQLIKRYLPKYNIDLRDDKNFLYIRITVKDAVPVVSFIRRPMDDNARYFGPFTSAWAVRKAMRYLRKVFPYVTHPTPPKRACLDYHIGLCPGPEVAGTDMAMYRRNLRRLMLYLSGKSGAVITQLEKDMKQAARLNQFEQAALLRDQANNLKALSRQHLFGDKEMFDLRRDDGLVELTQVLGLATIPRRIETYDISHLQGSDNVASMVVFSDGIPNRGQYRKFKMHLIGNDDFAHMREVMTRRFGAINMAKWQQPDLIIIDGGKGQVSAALSVLQQLHITIPLFGLAKREEEIIVPKSKTPNQTKDSIIKLSKTSPALQLLQHMRDEAHRFAVTYHSLLRSKRQTSSLLETIQGIGPSTRKKLLRHFGSLLAVRAADEQAIASIIGRAKARLVKSQLSPTTPKN